MTSRIVVFAVGVAGCGDCSDVGKPAEYGTPDAATGRDVGDSEAGGWDIDDSQDGGTVADAEIDVRVRENRRPWSADMSYPDVTDAPAPLGTVCDYSDYDCDRESNELCVGRACYQACDDTMPALPPDGDRAGVLRTLGVFALLGPWRGVERRLPNPLALL